MSINLIVANSANGVIGKNGCMPWHIPYDLKRFRLLTKDSIVLMGRKTYESIGKQLPDRYNFVISSMDLKDKNIYVFKDINCAISYAKKNFPNLDIFVIGGASIYNHFLKLDLIDNIYQTVINKNIEGDTYFSFDESDWDVEHRFHIELKNNDEILDCSYITWKRKNLE